MQRSRNEFYVDTKREMQDAPNLFSAFTEQYLAYRVPVAMAWMRARMEALASSSEADAAYAQALVDLEKERAAVAVEVAKLSGTLDTNAAQRDANFAQMFSSQKNYDAAEVAAQATTAAATVRAQADIATANIGRDTAAAKSTALTDETKKIADEANRQLQLMKGAIENGQLTPAAAARTAANIRSLVDTVADPPARQGLQNRINELVSAYAVGVPADQRAPFGDMLRMFPAADPTNATVYEPGQFGAGIRRTGGTSMSEFAPEYVSSGARALATVGGAPSTSTSTTVSAGSSGPTRGASAGDQGLGADAFGVLKRQMDDLAKAGEEVRAMRAEAARDPYRGLGGFYDAIPDDRPARVRTVPAETGGPAEPKPAKAPREKVPMKERVAKLAGTFLGGAMDRAFTPKEERDRERAERKKAKKEKDGAAFTGPNSDDNRVAFTGPNSDDNRRTRKRADPTTFIA
jgi:hypothetical protein